MRDAGPARRLGRLTTRARCAQAQLMRSLVGADAHIGALRAGSHAAMGGGAGQGGAGALGEVRTYPSVADGYLAGR